MLPAYVAMVSPLRPSTTKWSSWVPSVFQRLPHFVDKILKGFKPTDIPAEQPTRFDFVVNSRPPVSWASASPRQSSPRRRT